MKALTITDLIVGIAGSLIATGLIAIVTARSLYFRQRFRTFTASKTGRSLGKTLNRDPQKAVNTLVRWLAKDQSKKGIHYGQFGRGANPKEERLFQTSQEALAAKPRLYLTGWPCFILHDLTLGKRQLSLAVDGLNRLLANGPIEVSLGASAETPPDSQPSIRSYRHTIRAIQILLKLEPNNPLVRPLVGMMLDERNEWQNSDGGWKQCDREHTNSDLWGSAYALACLADLVSQHSVLPHHAQEKARLALLETLQFIKGVWSQSRWKYGDASSEQNGVQILHETIRVITKYDSHFSKELARWLKTWLSPSGVVSQSYFSMCSEVSLASVNARVAYALFVAGESQDAWYPLVETAVNQFDGSVNSSDVAFLLHLICTRHHIPR